MAAATGVVPKRPVIEFVALAADVKDGETYEKGWLLARDSSGDIVVPTEVTTLLSGGYAGRGVTSASSDDDSLQIGIFSVPMKSGDTLTSTSNPAPIYFVNNYEVGATGTGRSIAGLFLCVDPDDSARAFVDVSPNGVAIAKAIATANAGVGVVHRSATITQAADLAGLGAGVKTLTKALGAALPANARYVGHVVGSGTFTGFNDPGPGTYTIKLGSSSDDDAIVATANVANGQTGFPKTGTAGVRAFSQCPLYAEVHNVILTSSVDLNTSTAGALTVDLFYLVLA